MKVGIIGLGMIGGSLARDLAALGHTVVGSDRSAATLRAARRAKIIAHAAGRGFDALRGCDVCVVAVPVNAVASVLARATDALAGVPLITDVGSTKRSTVRAATRLGLASRFVGAHPLAGHHRAGWPASREGLFADKPVYLTPTAETTLKALRSARALWHSVGGKIVVMDAAAHDTLVSATSHLPQVASLALAMLLAERRIARPTLGRGGRDMTRLAASNADVWAAILADNRSNVAPLIARYRTALGMIERAIRDGNVARLHRLISSTGQWAGEVAD